MEKPRHAPLVQFPILDDELVVGGLRLRELADRVAQTPFYAYDRSAIATRIAQLRATLPAGLSLHYAIKANPMPDLVREMVALVDGFDVASAGELNLAIDSGMDPLTRVFNRR